MNYIEYNGRKISVRPAVKDYEIDVNGAYVRQIPWFREPFGESYKNPVEKDRYTLFWAKDCAWSNRVAIIYSLLGLYESIKEVMQDLLESFITEAIIILLAGRLYLCYLIIKDK